MRRYYDVQERAEAIAAASLASAGMAAAGDDDRLSARSFIKFIMADFAEPTPEGLAGLQDKALSMSDAAMGIIARVVGVSNADQCRCLVRDMTPFALTQLRDSLGTMGLGHNHSPGV